MNDYHPQDETTLDTIGYSARIALIAVLVIIACIRLGYGG